MCIRDSSYIHAEGYPAGEMKHGPNALIDENLPVVFIATYDEKCPFSKTRYEKVLNNVKEVKSRDGILVSLGLANDEELQENSDQYVVIPVSYTHLRAHETPEHLVCRLLLEKKN